MLAGLVSFASPCVLPLVPGYLSYVTGLTGSAWRDRPARRQAAESQQVPLASGAADGGWTARPGGSPHGGPASQRRRPPGRVARSLHRPRHRLVRGRVALGTLVFVLGFSAVFVSYGALFGGLGARCWSTRT